MKKFYLWVRREEIETNIKNNRNTYIFFYNRILFIKIETFIQLENWNFWKFKKFVLKIHFTNKCFKKNLKIGIKAQKKFQNVK